MLQCSEDPPTSGQHGSVKKSSARPNSPQRLCCSGAWRSANYSGPRPSLGRRPAIYLGLPGRGFTESRRRESATIVSGQCVRTEGRHRRCGAERRIFAFMGARGLIARARRRSTVRSSRRCPARVVAAAVQSDFRRACATKSRWICRISRFDSPGSAIDTSPNYSAVPVGAVPNCTPVISRSSLRVAIAVKFLIVRESHRIAVATVIASLSV